MLHIIWTTSNSQKFTLSSSELYLCAIELDLCSSEFNLSTKPFHYDTKVKPIHLLTCNGLCFIQPSVCLSINLAMCLQDSNLHCPCLCCSFMHHLVTCRASWPSLGVVYAFLLTVHFCHTSVFFYEQVTSSHVGLIKPSRSVSSARGNMSDPRCHTMVSLRCGILKCPYSLPLLAYPGLISRRLLCDDICINQRNCQILLSYELNILNELSHLIPKHNLGKSSISKI